MDGKTGAGKFRGLRIAVAVIVAIAIVSIAALAVYASDYYHADERAMFALRSTDDVQVRTLDDGCIAFEPTDPQAGIAFYPGGKVQAEAYAPLMKALAERGFLGVIVPMPFNLAVFNVNGADGVQEKFPEVKKWVLAGHSLGGSMAATYIDGHSESWAGLVLLGAYSTVDLSDNDVDILCIRGSNDEVLNKQAYINNRANLGLGASELVIPGGNHAQFGDYGTQSGDGEPEISAWGQQALVADAIAETFLD